MPGGRKGRSGSSVVDAGRVEPPWIGPVTGRTYNPGRREAGWTDRRYHLGKTKRSMTQSFMFCTRLQRSLMSETSVIKPKPSSQIPRLPLGRPNLMRWDLGREYW